MVVYSRSRSPSRASCLLALVAGLPALGACGSPTTPATPVDQFPNGPKITCPATPGPLTSLDGQPIPVQYGAAIATGGAPTVSTSCTPPSGSTFPIGSTEVICTATDGRQRKDSCNFNVVVQAPPHIAVTHFVAFGDDITWGEDGSNTSVVSQSARGLVRPAVQLPTAQTYPGALELELRNRYNTQNPTVTNAGVAGESAGDPATLSRFRKIVVVGGFDSVLLMEGSNDLANPGPGNIPPAIANLRAMLDDAKGRAMRPYLATVPPMVPGGSRAQAWSLVPMLNDQIRQLAMSENVPLVDIYAGFGDSFQQYIGPDGLHPNAAGYAKIADLFFAALKSTLESPPAATATRGNALPSIRRPRP